MIVCWGETDIWESDVLVLRRVRAPVLLAGRSVLGADGVKGQLQVVMAGAEGFFSLNAAAFHNILF